MMPYLVTTKRAVATLEEAKDALSQPVTDACVNDQHALWATLYTFAQRVADIPESGGTVGPLPDGTVIEVSQVGWEELSEPFTPSAHFGNDAILAAYNAREAQHGQ